MRRHFVGEKVTLVIVGICFSTVLTAAESKRGFELMTQAEASQASLGADGQRTSAAMWTWTDKIAYMPGEPLTLRWTVKRNNDNFPYTIVAFRQNNQTGAKTYVSQRGASSTPVDIFGNEVSQGFQITRLPEATKQVLIGSGGLLINSPLTVPNEPGMHTIVIQLRDYTGRKVVKSAYWKFGVYTNRITVSGNIASNTTWTNNNLYVLSGIVSVLNNATLTIEPGTIIQGSPGSQPPSVLLITTAGKINAQGTRSRPIIMTSTQPVGRRNRGDWGGLILLGRARINDPSGALNIEGLPDLPETRYGGTDDSWNCGSLRYVRVEFAGSLLRPNEETNSFTWGACGSETKGEYLQAHYGLDDAFEWFGGNNSVKRIVGTYAADDYVDTQIGARPKIQFGVFVANDDRSNRGIEADNYERGFDNQPYSKGVYYNLTFVGGGSQGFDEADASCMFFRRGTAGLVFNSVCYHWVTRGIGGADFASIEPRINAGEFNMNGIVLWDNGFNTNPPAPNTLQGQVAVAFQPFASVANRQILIEDPQMIRPLERSDPDFRPALGSVLWRAGFVAPPDDGFFEQSVEYAGAFGEEDWTEEWATFHQEQDLQP